MTTTKRPFGPVALTATLTTNIYQGGGNGASSTIHDVITHIHVTNKTAGAAAFSLWLGATGANAAGTELFNAQTVAAYSSFDYYGRLMMTSSDFLVGGASSGTTLTIYGEGYQEVP